MAKGAAWMVGMRLAVRGIGLVSTIVLARLLRPEDFGLVALASALVGAIEMFSQFSLDLALIREGAAERSHYDTVWTLSLMRGVLIAALLAALAVPAGHFFRDVRVTPIVYCFALGSLLEGFQNVGIVDFRKHMTFGREFLFTVSLKIIGFVVTIAFALIWREYWALIAGIMAGKVAGLGLSYALHPYRPKLCLTHWHSLFHFSKWLLLNNIVQFLINRLDAFLIGRMLGARAFGLYDISLEIATLPTAELVAPVQRALFPGYAKVASDLNEIRAHYITTFSLVLALALPAAIGIALLPELIVDVFLGPKWHDAEPLLQVLAFVGLLHIGAAHSGSVLLALGKVRMLSQLTLARLLVLGPLLALGISHFGLAGATYALVATAAFSVMLYVGITLRILALAPTAILHATWRTIVAAVIMAAGVHVLLASWPHGLTGAALILELASAVAAGALIYTATHLVLWRLTGSPAGAERNVLTAVEVVLRRWRGATA